MKNPFLVLLPYAPIAIVAALLFYFTMQRLKRSRLPWLIKVAIGMLLYAATLAAMFGITALIGWPKL